MNAPMDISMRRGACPGLSAPMATGDGLLARLTPAGSTISLDAFAGLCAAARTHGNGIVEITSRGSIQVRGLSAASAPLFAAEVASLGIEASDGIPVVTDPLAGLTDDGHLRRPCARRAIAGGSGRCAVRVSTVGEGVCGDRRRRGVASRCVNGRRQDARRRRPPFICLARRRCRDRNTARRRPVGARGRMYRPVVRNAGHDIAAVSHARGYPWRRIEHIQIRGCWPPRR